jgi:hypothetical protein
MFEQQAPDRFKREVFRAAETIGVSVKEVHIRKMKRKWASCSAKGRLTFDPDLLVESRENRCKTVLHELLHLRYPNHGRMFRLMLNVYAEKFLA